jgi:2-polyprenyl-3-methyl-5-hydroxy-6-metoxy-1,4-benzoquinol methylase
MVVLVSGIGPAVRKKLGRLEVPAANAFRGLFFNLNAFESFLGSLPNVQRVLEVGAGDGAVAERLHRAFPDADYLGIDLIDVPGRLYREDRSQVTFKSVPLEEISATELFDLIVMVDVIHHVPIERRLHLLQLARSHVQNGGYFIVKDWNRIPNLSNLVQYRVERHLSGDKTVFYFSPDEWDALLHAVFGSDLLLAKASFPPHVANNFAAAYQIRAETENG